ncbi:hypothetical protein HMPREF1986_02238 [Oribacterium sp. oral taxon 078 str. F0263]|nr:hypothetical protein HMPREF1986_02238 [Oribacterium sp. oral taxon 078 str. F0263]
MILYEILPVPLPSFSILLMRPVKFHLRIPVLYRSTGHFTHPFLGAVRKIPPPPYRIRSLYRCLRNIFCGFTNI